MSAESDAAAAAWDALTAALDGPAVVTSDAGTIQQHNLKDIAAVADRLAAKAAARKPSRGLRFTRLLPPGAA